MNTFYLERVTNEANNGLGKPWGKYIVVSLSKQLVTESSSMNIAHSDLPPNINLQVNK